MTPYCRWTTKEWPRKRPANELMCIECGAVRPTFHFPRLMMDQISRTIGPLILMSLAIYAAQEAANGGENA